MKKCETCNGLGYYRVAHPDGKEEKVYCERCDGKGKIELFSWRPEPRSEETWG